MKKAQEWFLLKKNWMEDMADLSNEDFGSLVRSLFFDIEPVGTQRILFKTLRDEFNRVNETREETLRLKREGSAKGVEAKAKLTREHKERMLEVAEGLTSGEPVDDRTHTHTRTHTLTEDRGQIVSIKSINIDNEFNEMRKHIN
jgi:hypothetical protein